MTMVTLRWLIVCAVLLPFVRGPSSRYLPELRRHWRFLAAMALSGYTGFNVLFYLAGYWTSAVNITLLQGSIPPMVLAGAALFKGEPVTPRQIAGMVRFLPRRRADRDARRSRPSRRRCRSISAT